MNSTCSKCGLKINASTHSYSDIGGYECYNPPKKNGHHEGYINPSGEPSIWPHCEWCGTPLERFAGEAGRCPECGAYEFNDD